VNKAVFKAAFVIAACTAAIPARATDLNNEYTAQGGIWAIYRKNCSGCHGFQGQGIPPVAPPLMGNPFVMSSAPAAIKATIRNGRKDKEKAYPQYLQPGGYMSMPTFANNVITDRELDQLVTYLKGPFQQGRFNN
jgi:mono/diheme cytochrome c family protein